MSATTQETSTSAKRSNKASLETGTSHEAVSAANGHDATGTAQTVTIEIADMQVTLPVKFSPGMVLTDAQARILQAAYERQFTNNENALAKSRTEGKNKTPQPTAEELALKFSTYEPNVGGTRIGSMEKIRNDAAWRMWSGLVAQHNASILRGGEPVIAKAGKSAVPALKPSRGPDGRVTITVQEKRDSMVARILTMPEYADKVQAEIDAILAEKGKGTEVANSASTVEVDSLL